MNIYDVLRKLVEARQWTDQERTDALVVITDLEKVHAFGTSASQIDERDHECERRGLVFPFSMQCKFCGKGMDPPSHGCLPVETQPGGTSFSWRGTTRLELRCKICNKEMR